MDQPLKLSLERLQQEEWSSADILMVTDGEIPTPGTHLLEQIETMHEELGLEVHGLLVGSHTTPAMKQLCTHLHQFKSWSAVDSRAGYH